MSKLRTVAIRIPVDALADLDALRRSCAHPPSRSAAARSLVEWALEQQRGREVARKNADARSGYIGECVA
jgi:hypothetical protein